MKCLYNKYRGKNPEVQTDDIETMKNEWASCIGNNEQNEFLLFDRQLIPLGLVRHVTEAVKLLRGQRADVTIQKHSTNAQRASDNQ